MKLFATDSHLSWKITTIVNVDNPKEWRPPEPYRLCIHGTATLGNSIKALLFSSSEPQVVISKHFTDENLADEYRQETVVELQQIINELRVK